MQRSAGTGHTPTLRHGLPGGVLLQTLNGPAPSDSSRSEIGHGTDLADAVPGQPEVVEALKATMSSQTTPPVSSDGYHVLPGELSGPVGALLAYPYSQREFLVTFGEYGKGRLTVLIW